MQNIKFEEKSSGKPKQLAIMPPGESHVAGTAIVIDSMWAPLIQKCIEQVGSGYEALKRKYARLAERIENGASAAFTDSESSDEESKDPLSEKPRSRK